MPAMRASEQHCQPHFTHIIPKSGNGYVWTDPQTGKLALEQVDYFKAGFILLKFHMGWTGSLGWRHRQ